MKSKQLAPRTRTALRRWCQLQLDRLPEMDEAERGRVLDAAERYAARCGAHEYLADAVSPFASPLSRALVSGFRAVTDRQPDRLRKRLSELVRLCEGKSAADAVPLVSVDLNRCTVTVDGEPHDVSRDQALFLNVLAEHQGWVATADIRKAHSTEFKKATRFDRLRKELPAKVRNLVLSMRGTGFRLI